jgi:glycosyltransferase involved in cell wall biosynthesis
MTPLVSVLLPYRDAAETIEPAITSLLSQSHRELEVLAVDDGSTDSGPQRVARAASRDPRVRCLRTGGMGIVPALQRAMADARGSLIARMDGDDISLPMRLQTQIACLAEHESLGAVGVRVEGFPAEAIGEGLKRYIDWQNGLVTADDHSRELFVEAPLCHPSVMLRRAALEAVGGWQDVVWPEDYDLWLRLDATGWALAKVPEVLFQWRHHAGRATFRDGRYSIARFREAKAGYLARRVKALGLPMVVWGAGPTGKRMARALEAHGLTASFFVDIDPRKVGRTARGAPIQAPDTLGPGVGTIVVAVGARGARELIRGNLTGRGFREGVHFLFAS